MKKFLLVLATFLCFSFIYSQNANFCDGPYVSYSGGEVIVRKPHKTNPGSQDAKYS